MKLLYVKLGTDSTKSEDGNGFTGEKGGGWDLYKMFYNNAEFYFNINTKTGDAEILQKDGGYADELLTGLRRELEDEQEEIVVKHYY